EITKGYVPENTKKSTASAIRVFNEWKFSREDEQLPGNLLTDGNPEQLNYWIPRFVNEARESDRQPYPPRTINQLLAGIQRHMLTENHLLPKFVDRSNAIFRPIYNACDAVFYDLHKSGVETSIQHANLITEEESLLWERGILGTESPKALLRAVFFYVGKRFCLRGGEEQRRLWPLPVCLIV
uniref:Uncharacterized protein n=1 Tax=Amphimedon queenslandica TaxID=400682 RepID=A0A1X7T4Q1_AMPQE